MPEYIVPCQALKFSASIYYYICVNAFVFAIVGQWPKMTKWVCLGDHSPWIVADASPPSSDS